MGNCSESNGRVVFKGVKQMKKLSVLERRLIILHLMMLSHDKRSLYLKKKNIFYHFGNDVKWAPSSIPSEPYLVSIGDNVRVAAGVTFITHDIINGMIYKDPVAVGKFGKKSSAGFHMGTIEVGDHVMIGAQTIIMPGKRIGSHVIIAAGSVITRNVPDGTIVGGNPAKIIGDYYDIAKKRLSEDMPSNTDDIKTINNYFWGDKA